MAIKKAGNGQRPQGREEDFVGSPKYAKDDSAWEVEENKSTHVNRKTHASTLCGQKLEFSNIKAVVCTVTAVFYFFMPQW